MNCKNCEKNLPESANYCDACGAIVVSERITLKKIVGDFSKKFFGWDNRFLVTVRKMISQPQVVLKDYISGTRKRFSAPFAFFAIGAAISILMINQFDKEFREINSQIGKIEINENDTPEEIEIKKKQEQFSSTFYDSLISNWNFYSFLLLPIYTLIAWWVFGGPYNYGEHLVINAYIQGLTFLLVTIFFLLNIWVYKNAYAVGHIAMVAYYSYAYAKLYQHSFGRTILKLLKFLGISILLLIASSVLSYLIGFMIG